MKLHKQDRIKKLPNHLKQYIIAQQYDRYTAIDHAVWRHVMQKNHAFISKLAHRSYRKGLKQTGLKIDHIANMEEMNLILQKIGWIAVGVNGFIPPRIFMEFQAYKVLVIAMDIRTIEHIEYTPTPDIIHEAAGHAPIIANAEYSEYLVKFGEIGSKAFSSSKDLELFEAIRALSIIKENPNTTEKELREAETHLETTKQNMGTEQSEIAMIRQLHWWTVEYGLIGTLDNPKLYGAGLLSSFSEAVSCLKTEVKKIPYSLDSINYVFDITKPQPQLFVTPNFKYLSEILEEFSNTMAYKKGGVNGLTKAINSKDIATVVCDSSLQVSGIFSEIFTNTSKLPIYIKTVGPSCLSFENKELENHGIDYHSEGFGLPLGKIKTPIQVLKIDQKKQVDLTFESGLKVEGKITNILQNKKGEIMLISFTDCTVSYENNIFFHPDWGDYDMAICEQIISAFPGAADQNSYKTIHNTPSQVVPKIKYSKKTIELQSLYQKVRTIRENKKNTKDLKNIWVKTITNFPKDWLLSHEVLEYLTINNLENELQSDIKNHLNKTKEIYPELSNLIEDGFKLINFLNQEQI